MIVLVCIELMKRIDPQVSNLIIVVEVWRAPLLVKYTRPLTPLAHATTVVARHSACTVFVIERAHLLSDDKGVNRSRSVHAHSLRRRRSSWPRPPPARRFPASKAKWPSSQPPQMGASCHVQLYMVDKPIFDLICRSGWAWPWRAALGVRDVASW